MSKSDPIKWTKLLAESAAIVASILLAFAIDAWWDERKERRYEQETVLGLKAEYEEHYKDISWQIDFHGELLRGITTLLQACSMGRYEDAGASIDDAVWASLVPVTTDLGSSVRDSLINSGRIEIISNIELRKKLADWDRYVDELTDTQLDSADLVRDQLMPYYAKHGIGLAHGNTDKDGTPWPIVTKPSNPNSEAFALLFKDRAYCTTLEFRYANMNHTLDEYRYVLEAIEEIQSLLEEP
ncbi:hypothetical protein R0137_02210 [Congregibacter brevis]|uniref:Uncharacterized protein n=1 Tax=Congregibacter brevis TaxID=3081201 RepID=A0ABZ0IED2_9GAMM|nr:hypothetical protein R0137_02210 [Congregibacter sp. IMCC45268]